MEKYAARHHVGLGSYTARPGEIIEQELTEEQAQWLLSIGAIEALPAFYADAPDMGDDGKEQEEAPEDLDDGKEQEEEQEQQPPEIDAMDGITAETATEEPKKKGGKRK